MRLIHTQTFQLREFLDDAIPPYAVLSHTWGDDELVYEDMLKGPAVRETPGFAKIRGCCETARQFRLDWAWIDTICINKSSSAELSEAINSMFAWYQASQVCFAFLSDVKWDSDRQGQYKIDGIRLLGRSRWFTRGWTLQEILAPSEVVFLDQTWRKIGTKKGFADMLETITSIRRVFLVFPQRLNEASVAERLSWAANRRTSRKEDMAYCLLGLLGINMPLLYGEGHKAFHRLHQEIIRNTYDHTVLAWGLYASPSAQLQYIGGTNREAPPLFAPGPNAFENWNPANRTLSEGQHYVFTNLGLYIDLLTIPFHTPSEQKKSVSEKREVAPSLGLALLDCYEWSPGGRYRVALPLQLYDRGSSHTAPLARRARSARPFLVPAHVEKLGKRMSMYLQDGIRAKNVQSNAMWSIDCHALFSKGYMLDDYFPPTHVDVVHDRGARNILCLYSEPGTEYSLLRLRHDKYNTVLLLIEHPKAVTRLKATGEDSSDQLESEGQTKSTATENQNPGSSGMAQLWITSTDNMKTAFEMALQPSYTAISFQYIVKEFEWTSLGNIASSIATTSSGLSPWASVPPHMRQITAAFRQSARSSLPATPYPVLTNTVHHSDQVKTIEAGVLEQIRALQVIDPALLDDDDNFTQVMNPGTEDLHTSELLGIAGKGTYTPGRRDEERAERLSMVIDLAMRVQEKTWHYAVNRPS